jgi:putative transposase
VRQSQFTGEQIALALRQVEARTPVTDISRKLEITETTFYRWKRKFGGLGVTDLRELKQLRDDDGMLKRLGTDLTLDKRILQESLRKNGEPGRAAGVDRLGG